MEAVDVVVLMSSRSRKIKNTSVKGLHSFIDIFFFAGVDILYLFSVGNITTRFTRFFFHLEKT